MNREQTELCREIFDEILRRPTSRLFWELDYPDMMTNVKVPMTFGLISDRLSRGLYRSPDEFIADMRILFAKAIKAYKNGVRAVAAAQLSSQFEHLTSDLSPSMSVTTTRLQLACSKMERLVDSLRPCFIAEHKPVEGEPAAEVIKNPRTDPDVSEIADDIRGLSSPTLLLRVLAFVYKTQPEAVRMSDEEMSIEFALLTDESLAKIREFVNGLLKKAAKGEINPFMKGLTGVLRPACGRG